MSQQNTEFTTCVRFKPQRKGRERIKTDTFVILRGNPAILFKCELESLRASSPWLAFTAKTRLPGTEHHGDDWKDRRTPGLEHTQQKHILKTSSTCWHKTNLSFSKAIQPFYCLLVYFIYNSLILVTSAIIYGAVNIPLILTELLEKFLH